MTENKFSFGKNALFDIDISSIIPNVLDEINKDDKIFYVKVYCKDKDEVKNILNIFEKLNIEKKRITISA